MVTTGNYADIENALREYMSNGDCSQAFILAGPQGIGKKALVAKMVEETGKDINFNYFSLSCNEASETSDNIFKTAISPSIKPNVIVIDIKTDADLRLLLLAGLNIILVKVTFDDWLSFTDTILKYKGAFNVETTEVTPDEDAPSEYSQKFIEEIKKKKKGVVGTVSAHIVLGDVDIDDNEFLLSFWNLYQAQYNFQIIKEDVLPFWEEGINVVKNLANPTNTKNQELIIREINKYISHIHQYFFSRDDSGVKQLPSQDTFTNAEETIADELKWQEEQQKLADIQIEKNLKAWEDLKYEQL